MKIAKNAMGFTLVEIMIVVAIIGLLAAIAVPNFVQARTNARRNSCINNLRLIQAAKDQSAMENNYADTSVLTATEISAYLKGGTASVWCPSDSTKVFATSYDINAVSDSPACNIDTAHVVS